MQNQYICKCNKVPYKKVVKYIQDGYKTLSEIKDKTKASDCCGGCEPNIIKLINEITTNA